MKQTGNRRSGALALSLLLLLIAVVTLVLLFMRQNSRRIADQNEQYLEDAAFQTAESMDRLFENASKSIRMVSYLYQLQLDEPAFDYHILNSMAQMTPFDYLRFVGPDGVSWSGDGEQVPCGDREYYLEGFQGSTGACFLPESRFTSGSVLIFYTPLYYDWEIIGVVCGLMEEQTLAERMEGYLFDMPSDTFLCLRDGTIAAFSGEPLPEGQDMTLSGVLGDRQPTADVARALEEGRSCTFRYDSDAGLVVACLLPLERSEFMLMRVFPPAAGKMLTERANQSALWLEIALIVVFLIFISLLFIDHMRSNRKLSQEKEDLGQIVNSVKRLYQRFVVFDLDNDSYEYLEEGDISALGIPVRGRYSDWLSAFRAKHDASPDYWTNMDNMTVDHLRTALTQENWFDHGEYRVGPDRWERLSLIRLDTGEHTSRILGAVEDITESRRRDEESRLALEEAFRASEAASRAKSEFLSRMSHDIRTPMNAIIGLTAIMGTHLDDRDRTLDCLSKINASSKHLLGLINEVLDMSKIESGKLELAENEFSLSNLTDCLLGIVQPMIRAKHQDLTVHIRSLVHENVVGDDLRLQQVCVNILSNAVKYTGEGGHITMTLTELPGKQPLLGEYEFVFEDDGIGMSPEFLQRVFTPFERADTEHTKNIQGTGLGMSIAQSIVRLMGGSILVESELGKGSRFTVRVSLRLQERNEDAEERLLGLPVLVADDDQVACESTCLLLDELGMQGEWVLTGQEAVERAVEHHKRNEDFFAVILDWKMPGMDGLETTKAIRKEIGPEVPIIILSAYDWSDIESEASAAGVDAFIGKPLFKSRLRGVFVDLMSDSPSDSTNALDAVKEHDYTGRRVLLVEDNPLNQEIAKEILEMTGLKVDLAENGKEAVERFGASSAGEYDMIFMDIQMPLMNGYEATRAIRSLSREDAARIPIVAMTANTFSEDVLMAQAAGMDQHIAKPLDLDRLNATLEKFLG